MQKLLTIFQQKILLTLYYIISETIFFLHGKKALLDKTYAWQRLCWTKPIPGIDYVGLCCYSRHWLCWIKLILCIGYAEQNLIWNLFVKFCKTRCFPSKKLFWKPNNRVFTAINFVSTVRLKETLPNDFI